VVFPIFFVLCLDFLDLPSGSPNSYDKLESVLVQTIRESSDMLHVFEKGREGNQASSEKFILKLKVQQLCCKGMLLTMQMWAQELSEETLAAELTGLDEDISASLNMLSVIIAKE
jgi:DNA-directed RNA polymerase subunit N (RpoN/RPB10)